MTKPSLKTKIRSGRPSLREPEFSCASLDNCNNCCYEPRAHMKISCIAEKLMEEGEDLDLLEEERGLKEHEEAFNSEVCPYCGHLYNGIECKSCGYETSEVFDDYYENN